MRCTNAMSALQPWSEAAAAREAAPESGQAAAGPVLSSTQKSGTQTGGLCAVISYEYPLNERIRTLLRLEDLFLKLAHFTANNGSQDHHIALLTLFETLEVASRADLKVDLVQELERQRQILVSFRNNPEISEEALAGALYEIEIGRAHV